MGKKHEPTVSQDVNKAFRERIEDAYIKLSEIFGLAFLLSLSNAVPPEQSLLSALHYALKVILILYPLEFDHGKVLILENVKLYSAAKMVNIGIGDILENYIFYGGRPHLPKWDFREA